MLSVELAKNRLVESRKCVKNIVECRILGLMQMQIQVKIMLQNVENSVKNSAECRTFKCFVDIDLGQNHVVECRKQCKKSCRMQNFWVLCRCRFLSISLQIKVIFKMFLRSWQQKILTALGRHYLKTLCSSLGPGCGQPDVQHHGSRFFLTFTLGRV